MSVSNDLFLGERILTYKHRLFNIELTHMYLIVFRLFIF